MNVEDWYNQQGKGWSGTTGDIVKPNKTATSSVNKMAANDTSGQDWSSVGAKMAVAQGQPTSATDAAATAAMMSGNPVAMGAGLGLMTLSGIQKQKQAEKQQDEMNKYNHQVNSLNNLMNWARTIKAM